MDRRTDDGPVLEAKVHELSTPELLKALGEEVRFLAEEEGRIAKRELTEVKEKATSGGAMLGVGGFLAACGFLGLMCFGIAALALALPVWASALIIGGVVLLVGAGLAYGGYQRFKSVELKDTQHSLKENQRWLTQTLSRVRSNVRAHASA